MNATEEITTIEPRQVALIYDAFVAASWRGADLAAAEGQAWFEAHWVGQAPPEPNDPPDAASVFGAAGNGIRWYAREDLLLGYAGRAGGCYQIVTGERVPDLPDPCTSVECGPGARERLSGDLRMTVPITANPATDEVLLDERTVPLDERSTRK
ncbi:MAG: hypothetical protein U0031_20825 [Thermomicrobiales bacterium]